MKKLIDLTTDHKYTALSYRPVETKFDATYILNCRNDYNYDDEFAY